jgi:hypothetical protein
VAVGATASPPPAPLPPSPTTVVRVMYSQRFLRKGESVFQQHEGGMYSPFYEVRQLGLDPELGEHHHGHPLGGAPEAERAADDDDDDDDDDD